MINSPLRIRVNAVQLDTIGTSPTRGSSKSTEAGVKLSRRLQRDFASNCHNGYNGTKHRQVRGCLYEMVFLVHSSRGPGHGLRRQLPILARRACSDRTPPEAWAMPTRARQNIPPPHSHQKPPLPQRLNMTLAGSGWQYQDADMWYREGEREREKERGEREVMTAETGTR
ncbi:unnamed protein product [Protopolystoma xenopodis]|uniref:Uncharacterized protein n=1 Tax=Protopolystoma xenopodis TaxID=117903 RepID=A0A3S5AK54_9PLAT|nr:unnamed protein product [Protopolystoma xenopodis]